MTVSVRLGPDTEFVFRELAPGRDPVLSIAGHLFAYGTPAEYARLRYVSEDDVITVKDWAALFGLSDPAARTLLAEKRIIYRILIGRVFSESKGDMVDVHEWRAYAGRVTFEWFDLRPQLNVRRHHNNQLRHTLYVRSFRALELGRKVGLTQPIIPGSDVAVRGGDAA